MSARRIAREIAVILLPQLPKDDRKLDDLQIDHLVARSVQMLTEHARQCLSEADSYITRSAELLSGYELDHPDNARKIEDVRPVNLTTGELAEQLHLLRLSVHLISEALDLPEMALGSCHSAESLECPACGKKEKKLFRKAGMEEVNEFVVRLVRTFHSHKDDVDRVISSMKTKWRMERMVSIDRDILRLACTEALFMDDIPIKVALSEAVELAHRFADERAAKYINGVLADLAEGAQSFRAKQITLDELAEGKPAACKEA